MELDKMKEAQKLTKYPGIGKIRARTLIDHFGTYAKVINAKLDELILLLGESIGQRLYSKIHNSGEQEDENIKFGRSPDYTTDIGESIANMYARGEDSIKDIMKHHGFSEQTFYNWRDQNLEFFELIKSAQERRRTNISQLADQGMKKLLVGYEVNEQTTVAIPTQADDGTRKNVVKETRVSKRHIPPNATMIIFAKCNTDPDNFRHIQHIIHEGGDDIPPYDFTNLDDEEMKVLEKLQNKLMGVTEE